MHFRQKILKRFSKLGPVSQQNLILMIVVMSIPEDIILWYFHNLCQILIIADILQLYFYILYIILYLQATIARKTFIIFYSFHIDVVYDP